MCKKFEGFISFEVVSVLFGEYENLFFFNFKNLGGVLWSDVGLVV